MAEDQQNRLPAAADSDGPQSPPVSETPTTVDEDLSEAVATGGSDAAEAPLVVDLLEERNDEEEQRPEDEAVAEADVPETNEDGRSGRKRTRGHDPPRPGDDEKKAKLDGGASSPPPPSSPDNQDEDDGAFCTICFEPWTNSGEHRIISLKCGHFFGLGCIEKWLKSTTGGSDCPNCNERATRKDIRLHYVARLRAVDTAEKDRAVAELERLRAEFRGLQLEHTTLKVTNRLQCDEIERLRKLLSQQQQQAACSGSAPGASGMGAGAPVMTFAKLPANHAAFSNLTYVKRMELIKSDAFRSDQRDRYCRLMAFNEGHAMLAVTQPSFTALAPGYGVRRVNMLDAKPEKFVALHREPIRDLRFSPLNQDLLLSVSQDKSAKLTNISSCTEIKRYQCEAEAWSCCWDLDDPNVFYVGTKRSHILVFDTRDSSSEPRRKLEYPVPEMRPIIGLEYVPARGGHAGFPCGGLFVLTLGSLWFFQTTTDVVDQARTYSPFKLPLNGLFWSMRLDVESRLLLVSSRPSPHSRHTVLEPTLVNISTDPTVAPVHVVTTNTISDIRKGGSYTDRSFLRSAIFKKPDSGGVGEGAAVVVFGKGSALSDQKFSLQEVGSDRLLQEAPVPKPILDVCSFSVNNHHLVAFLCETEVLLYRWV